MLELLTVLTLTFPLLRITKTRYVYFKRTNLGDVNLFILKKEANLYRIAPLFK